MAKLCGISLFVVLLSLAITSASGGQQKKIRQKREWIIPPHKLRENKDYTQQDYIAKIRSDEETRTKLQYFLTGAGADRPPVNLFTVNRENGWVKINGLLDREETPIYYLRGVAKYLNGSSAERDIDLRIVVEDENDCAPVFNFTIGSVYELSKKETFVITVIATDGDEPGHLNSKISYNIVQDSHSGMFYINRETGHIYVMHNTLDREKKDKYTLTIRGTDRFGEPNGISGTGTVVINILDVNDNIPTLENNIYECSVEENTKNVIVTKIQAFDADLIYSENWLAVFTIVSGNEANYFSIRTDNKTNQGILTLNKELDFEELKEIHLHVSVSNKAPYHSSVVITESKTYTVRVKVINQPEGPRFQPAVKVITISENSKSIVTEKKVIATYAAIDSDTLLIAKDVRYAKGQDVDNWLIIDERTAEIRLNKEVDYESKFVINKTYIAHIICITNETPAKTATGTIAIQVQDFNDHCPVLVHQSQRLCYEDHVVYVTAVDQDHFPNAAPFGFKVDTVRTKESWRVEHFNETTAILRSQTTLWPGVYNLFVDVWDQQAKICAAQMLRIDVCQCDASKVCLPEKTVTRFGVSGVFLMLLGLLLLLLVPLLLLFCLCGGAGAAGDFKAIPFDAKELLIAYNTEGQGEDKAMALLQMTKDHDDMLTTQQGVGGGQKWSDGRDGAMGAGESHWSTFNQYNQHEKEYHHHQQQHESQTDGGFMYVKRKGEYSRFDTYDGLALSEAFLGNYYSQKTGYAAKNQDMGDCPKVYDYEGRESYMGSFEDICSLIPEDNDLSFLNDLDIRFKTLAEICSGSTIEAEISTTTHVTSKPAPSTTHKDVNVQGTSSLLHSQKKGSSSTTIHTSGSQQASSSSSTGVYVHEKMVVPNQTLLVQQPTVYYAPATPIYVVEPHPTVLVTPNPVFGIQENLLVEEQRGSDAALREMQHYQSVVLVEKQPTKASVQAQGSVSGTLQIVNTEVMQSTESHEVRRAIHPVRTAREREVCGSLEMRVPQSL